MGRVFTEEEALSFFKMILSCNAYSDILGFYRAYLSETDEFIGMFAMTQNEDYDAIEFEYMLLPEYWGKGYATDLIQTQIQMVRAAFPGKKLIAITDPTNERSIHVLMNNSFTEGTTFINDDGDNARLFVHY